jgi:hypothetical protein
VQQFMLHRQSVSFPCPLIGQKPQQTMNGEEIMAAMAGSPDVQKAIVDYLDSPLRSRTSPRKTLDYPDESTGKLSII